MQAYLHKQLSTDWLRAAVLGSLWASFEIIAGSFLHNLRLPFSGTILTAASVFLIIAFIQIWKEPGMIWRAGLICALMKSLSPSAVILGPMIGIFTEALIIWLMVGIVGRNLFAYALGGALAVASALVHKVVNLFILYGFDLIRVFEGLYYFSVRHLHIENLEPDVLIGMILVVYLVIGVIAAIAGYLAGRRYKVLTLQGFKPLQASFTSKNELFSLSSAERYSLPLLFTHLVAMVICLWLLNLNIYLVSLPVCAAYLTGCFLRYKSALRHLKKPGLWMQFIVITLIAAFLLEGYSSGNYFSPEGLAIGLKMILRALVIMVGFTAISTELKNPMVRSLLYDRGLASLYQSLSLAFSALPHIIAQMPGARTMAKEHRSFLNFLFTAAQDLLIRFEEELQRRPSVYILTGEVGAGKTTFLASLTDKLKENGLRTAGFTAPGIFRNNRKEGFVIRDLTTGQEHILAGKSGEKNWIRFGHYFFNPETVRKGNDILLKTMDTEVYAVVIDEVGPMEMRNEGWAPAIETLCRTSSIPQIWVVRKSLVQKAARKWNTGAVFLFDVETDTPEDVCRQIIQNHSKKVINAC